MTLSHGSLFSWPLPTCPRPIVLIGAGGIVNDAHLPAYRKADLPVIGVFDVNTDRCNQTAEKWGVRAFDTLERALTVPGAVFDIAVPPEFAYEVVRQLPEGSTVLIQKPMGTDLQDARRIRDLCRTKKLIAAVNFQLRFAPVMLGVRSILDSGLLGKIVDVSFHFNLRTPWELFPFLKKLKRCEILVHTIHHLDFCRYLLGEPKGVYARTVRHPDYPELASVKTSIILDYGQEVRCCLSINHTYSFGPDDECADVRIQGTCGAIRVSLGLLLNYPEGKPETLDYCTKQASWQHVPVGGRWFPDGFMGIMSNLQRYAAGEDPELITNVQDAYRTMALVEACYVSDAQGATPIPD
ncbi:MAG: oxidoreductase [Phycisphaerae bacterium]|nr:MAG: oxidoreductase [Phycisphaerae bacterium]